jgi:Myb-like DNA-binding domain
MSVSMLLNAAMTVDEVGRKPRLSPSPAVVVTTAATAAEAASAQGTRRRIPIAFLLASDGESTENNLAEHSEHQPPCHSRGTSWGNISRQSSQSEPGSAEWHWSDLTASGDSRSSLDSRGGGGGGGVVGGDGPWCGGGSAICQEFSAAAGGQCTAPPAAAAAAAVVPMELASPPAPPALPAVPLMSLLGNRSSLLLAPFEFKGGGKRDWAGMQHNIHHSHNHRHDNNYSHPHHRYSQGAVTRVAANRPRFCPVPAPSSLLTHRNDDTTDGVPRERLREGRPADADDDDDIHHEGEEDSGEYGNIDSCGPTERFSCSGVEKTTFRHAGQLLGREEDERAPRRRWKDWEDALLAQVVACEGPSRWNEIAKSFPGRNGRQVRLRWMNHLQPSLDKAPWRQEEDEMLLSAHAARGNKWALIAAQLGGRTDNAVKNRFKSLQRRNHREQRAHVRSSFRKDR